MSIRHLYNDGIGCDSERGYINPNDQSFEVGVHGKVHQRYQYDRVFSGMFLSSVGRFDITATAESETEDCRLAYEVRFSYSN
jgi:hypothetical protein